MGKKSLVLAAGAGFYIAANTVSAGDCGSKPKVHAKDKGNYVCRDCDLDSLLQLPGHLGGFLEGVVDADVYQWRPGDVVTVSNGDQFVRLEYLATGLFKPKFGGFGHGPGKPRNHDGSGTLCEDIEAQEEQNDSDNSSSGSNGAYENYADRSYQDDPLADYWRQHDLNQLPDTVPEGNVYVEEVNPSASASYFSNYYANQYSPNQCAYC